MRKKLDVLRKTVQQDLPSLVEGLERAIAKSCLVDNLSLCLL